MNPVRNPGKEPQSGTPVFWLSCHASYACRDSGACCSSGWEIPLETGRVAAIGQAIDTGAIPVSALWLQSVEHAPAEIAGVIPVTPAGRCVFHQNPGCAIHSALGHQAMPLACQHFPRICLIDTRGVFVTLSHYCPTAAALLFEPQSALTIVVGPPALPGGAMPEGLDARDVLPPLASPQRLMDLEGYGEWEREMVHVLTTRDPSEALDVLEQRAGAFVKGPAPFPGRAARKGAGPFTNDALFGMARAAVPVPHAWPDAVEDAGDRVEEEWSASAPVIGRYLAAHAFASWTAYQGNGALAQVIGLRQALAVLRIETIRHGRLFDGVRHADLLLRHFVDRQTLADGLSAAATNRAT